jgi:hypothetical protein
LIGNGVVPIVFKKTQTIFSLSLMADEPALKMTPGGKRVPVSQQKNAEIQRRKANGKDGKTKTP